MHSQGHKTNSLARKPAFSRNSLAIFVILFAGVGGYSLWRSMALTPPATTSAASTNAALKTGDLNGDGRVDMLDLSDYLAKSQAGTNAADLNHDGTVNVQDLSVLLSNYNQ